MKILAGGQLCTRNPIEAAAPVTITVRPAMCYSSKPASSATGSRRARCFRVVDESNTK